ncbi:hypothetical protein M2322_004105 [Rhodoblastus acidophilus]|nr:hypothetical protein [Rhodoblastus acidophilus]
MTEAKPIQPPTISHLESMGLRAPDAASFGFKPYNTLQ